MRLSHFSLYFCCFFPFFFLFCGCNARIPEPVTYPYNQQQKSQAAWHWNVLAKDVANRINEQLVLTGNFDKSLYVEYNCGSDAVPCKPHETSPFNEAFRDLLITNLYNLQIPTRVQPDETALNINFKVQIVRHTSRRIQTIQPGIITALSAGIAVLRNAPANLILMASGGALDIANTSFVQSGHYEIIITTSIADNGEYFFRSSDLYYINDPDFWHYMETFPDGGQLTFSSRTSQQKEEVRPQRVIPRIIPVPQSPDTEKSLPIMPINQQKEEI